LNTHLCNLKYDLRRSMNTRVLSFLIFATIVNFSFAQTDTLTQELSEVIVTSNRIELPYAEHTRSIILISEEEIKKTPASSVAELLHYVAGVDVRSRGANGIQADIGIRGGTFDQSLILVNGIKISDMQTGHHSLNLPIDLSNVERIEVIKGPAARIYGQNAFSGAINIVTKSVEKSGVELQLTGGDFALFGGRVGASIKKEKQNHYLSVGYDQSEGYKHNTDYDIVNLFYQGSVQVGNGKIGVMSGITDRNFGANGFYASPDYTEQYESVLTGLGAISYSTLINNTSTLEARMYYRTNHDDYIFIRDNPDVYHNTHESNTLGFEINMSIPTNLGVTGVGVDFNNVTLASNNLGNRSRFVSTMFVEHRFEMMDSRLSITPGVQLNHYSDFGFMALPGIDLGIAVHPSFTVFASTGYTYRVPTFTDLYYVGPANVGNADLKPEYAWTYELGLKSTKLPGLIAQGSVFYRSGQSIIDWARQSDADPWQPLNVLAVNMKGVDSNLSFLVNELSDNENSFLQRVNVNYTLINSTFSTTEVTQSRYALENLRHQLSLGIQMRYFKSLHHSVYYNYYDRVNLTDYSLLDTRLSWEMSNYGVFVDVSNLLDIEYKETNLVTMPGRWAKIGVNMSF